MEETLLLLVCTWVYNDVEGSDANSVERNILLAFLYSLYGSGALRVATDSAFGASFLNSRGKLWSWVIGFIIFTTMQMQDLKDQEGDRTRNRSTTPLVLGETVARWTIAIPVIFWSLFYSIFLKVGVYLSILPIAWGMVVAVRIGITGVEKGAIVDDELVLRIEGRL